MTLMAVEAAAPAASAEGAAAGTRARQAARQAHTRARTRQAASQYGGMASDVAGSARVTPGNRSYQGAILAEYLAAVLLVALSPVASGGSQNSQAKGSPSPYDANDLRQLVAVSAVYFVLALLSSGERWGRMSAWFGGLILLAIGVSKLGQGQLSAVFSMVGQQPAVNPQGVQVALPVVGCPVSERRCGHHGPEQRQLDRHL